MTDEGMERKEQDRDVAEPKLDSAKLPDLAQPEYTKLLKDKAASTEMPAEFGDFQLTDEPDASSKTDLSEIALKEALTTIPESDRNNMLFAMKAFEFRAEDGHISAAQMSETYAQVGRLLTTAEGPLSDEQRTKLAVQIMTNAALPTMISQGDNNTCNVTTVETAMYSRHPEEAAKFVVDLALTGRYTSKNGFSVSIDPTPRTEAAAKELPGDGERSHASEIFQVGAVNLAYAEKGLSIIKYEAFATGSSSGERLFDSVNVPPTFVKDTPELHLPDLLKVYAAISGSHVEAIQLSKTPSEEVHSITKIAELEYQLENFKKFGRLPAIVMVDVRNEPFNQPVLDRRYWHVVTVTDFHPETKEVELDNQWLIKNDFLGSKKLTLGTLFTAMHKEEDNIFNRMIDGRLANKLDIDAEIGYLREVEKLQGGAQHYSQLTELIDLVIKQSAASPISEEERKTLANKILLASLPADEISIFQKLKKDELIVDSDLTGMRLRFSWLPDHLFGVPGVSRELSLSRKQGQSSASRTIK